MYDAQDAHVFLLHTEHNAARDVDLQRGVNIPVRRHKYTIRQRDGLVELTDVQAAKHNSTSHEFTLDLVELVELFRAQWERVTELFALPTVNYRGPLSLFAKFTAPSSVAWVSHGEGKLSKVSGSGQVVFYSMEAEAGRMAEHIDGESQKFALTIRRALGEYVTDPDPT